MAVSQNCNLAWLLSGKFVPAKGQCEWKIGSKILNMNLIQVKKCVDFSGIAFSVVLWQSPISKHQLRVGN